MIYLTSIRAYRELDVIDRKYKAIRIRHEAADAAWKAKRAAHDAEFYQACDELTAKWHALLLAVQRA